MSSRFFSNFRNQAATEVSQVTIMICTTRISASIHSLDFVDTEELAIVNCNLHGDAKVIIENSTKKFLKQTNIQFNSSFAMTTPTHTSSYLVLWICLAFSSVLCLSGTVNRTLTIPAGGYSTIPLALKGPLDIGYDCKTGNDSPFTVLVLDLKEFDRWKADQASPLFYYEELSRPNFAKKQELQLARFSSDEKTNNLVVPAVVEVSLTISPTLFAQTTFILILVFALLGVIGVAVFLIRCLCRCRNRSKTVEYTPVGQQGTAVTAV